MGVATWWPLRYRPCRWDCRGCRAAARLYLRRRARDHRGHADGAKRVFLLGASYGGAVSLTYAPRLQVDGVISLSGETPAERSREPAPLGLDSTCRC
jgi:pimeloyl-ACP methyl ester carboxylesterase